MPDFLQQHWYLLLALKASLAPKSALKIKRKKIVHTFLGAHEIHKCACTDEQQQMRTQSEVADSQGADGIPSFRCQVKAQIQSDDRGHHSCLQAADRSFPWCPTKPNFSLDNSVTELQRQKYSCDYSAASIYDRGDKWSTCVWDVV